MEVDTECEEEARDRRRVAPGVALMTSLVKMVEAGHMTPAQAVAVRESFDTVFLESMEEVAAQGAAQGILKGITAQLETRVDSYNNIDHDWRLDGRLSVTVPRAGAGAGAGTSAGAGPGAYADMTGTSASSSTTTIGGQEACRSYIALKPKHGQGGGGADADADDDAAADVT